MSRLIARPMGFSQGGDTPSGMPPLTVGIGRSPMLGGSPSPRPHGMGRVGLAVSFAAHAVLLIWLLQSPGLGNGGRTAPTVMTVTLIHQAEERTSPPAEPPPPTAQQPAPQQPARVELTPPAPPPRVTAPPPAKTMPPAPARTTSRRAGPVPDRIPAPAPEPPAATDMAATVSAVSDSTALVAAPPSASGQGQSAEDALRRYGETIWALIARHKPRGGRLSGTSVVTFSIAPDGSVRSAEISATSGSAMLDRLALDGLREAAPFPPPPAEMTAEQATFSIPFEFR